MILLTLPDPQPPVVELQAHVAKPGLLHERWRSELRQVLILTQQVILPTKPSLHPKFFSKSFNECVENYELSLGLITFPKEFTFLGYYIP